MKDVYILAIETSCDETSISIVKNGNEVVALTILTQMDKHAEFGGVVPEIASRMHCENITMVLEDTLKKANMKVDDVDAIAVTYGPGLLGSLLVGVEFAKVLSYVYDKPLIKVNHLIGHIYANKIGEKMTFPSLALVISGGHTELIKMANDYEFELLGETEDDAIGEAFDKVARVLDLPYPGGPNIENLAKKGKDTYKLPKPVNDNSYNFSYSGLKSSIINLVHNETQRGNEIRKADLACSFENAAISSITNKTKKAIEEFNIKTVIIAGGVAANSFLREEMQKLCDNLKVDLSIPPMKYCTDNAAMIGAAGYYAYLDGRKADLKLNAKSQDTLI
jgi:N6-L-threonylcarbamoyladenine synthase